MKVLDLLCGTGRITCRLLSARKDLAVVGVDNADRMLAILRSRCSSDMAARLTIIKGKIDKRPTYPDSLGGVGQVVEKG